MPAGREGDICTFAKSPSDDDARLMTLAPNLVKALEDILEIEQEFRSTMPADWDGDPLSDACDAAKALLAAVGPSPDPKTS